MLIDAEILDAVAPKPAGPAGWDISYDIKNGADIKAGATSVDAQVNEQSLASARARSESGANKEVAATLDKPKGPASAAVSFIEKQRDKADTMYQSMFAKHGLSEAAERGMTLQPGRRRDHRAVLGANAPSKNPLMRIKQRQLLQLRKTFDEISAARKKSVALNPEMLPPQTRDKMIEASLEKGEQNTAFGHIPSPMQTAKTVGKVAYSAWKKWDAVGALAGGSFIDLAPSLKRR